MENKICSCCELEVGTRFFKTLGDWLCDECYNHIKSVEVQNETNKNYMDKWN